jgi:hypothetical protein
MNARNIAEAIEKKRKLALHKITIDVQEIKRVASIEANKPLATAKKLENAAISATKKAIAHVEKAEKAATKTDVAATKANNAVISAINKAAISATKKDIANVDKTTKAAAKTEVAATEANNAVIAGKQALIDAKRIETAAATVTETTKEVADAARLEYLEAYAARQSILFALRIHTKITSDQVIKRYKVLVPYIEHLV